MLATMLASSESGTICGGEDSQHALQEFHGMNDYSTTERVAIVVATLHHARRPIPTSTLARRIGISTGGAWAMLSRLSAVLPLTLDTDGWFLIER
jgi:hypothetical protein